VTAGPAGGTIARSIPYAVPPGDATMSISALIRRRRRTLLAIGLMLAVAGVMRRFTQLEQWPKRATFRTAGEPSHALRFSPDGRWLASGGGFNKETRLWDITGQQTPRLLPSAGWYVSFLRFTPDGRRLMGTDWNGHLAEWDLRSGAAPRMFPFRWPQWEAIALPDGQRLALRGNWVGPGDHLPPPPDPEVLRLATFVNWRKGGMEYARLVPSGEYICVPPGGKAFIVHEGPGYSLTLRETSTRAVILKTEGHATDFTTDGRFLLASRRDGTSWIYDLNARRMLPPIKSGEFAFSPDNTLLAIAATTLFDATAWTRRLPTPLQNTWLLRRIVLNFRPSGVGEVIVYEIATARPIARMTGGTSCGDVVFSPDGHMLAAMFGGEGAQGMITVYDLPRGRRSARPNPR